MAIVINFAGTSLRKPGAYSRTRIAQGGAAEAQLGVVALIGEADQGDANSDESSLDAVTFSPEQFTSIVDKYVSGPLVDAARLAIVPSNDPAIVGGAQQLILIKTNQSVKATYDLAPVGYIANYTALLAKLDLDVGVTDTDYESSLDPSNPALALHLTSFAALLAKLDSDAGVTDTDYASTLTVATSTWEALVTQFNLLLAKLDLDAGVTDTDYASTLVSSTDQYGTVTAKRAGKAGNNLSVEIADSSGQVVITIADAVTGDSEISDPLGGQDVMTIQVTDGGASAATLTISSSSISTSVTGGSSASLSIKKTDFATIGQLVDYINNQSGYAASVADVTQTNQPLSVLDRKTAEDILTSPVTIQRDSQDVQDFFDDSALVDFSRDNPGGYFVLPSPAAKTFLSGGEKGGTTNADILTGLDQLLKLRVNFVVPLFSRDASDDITDELTEATSTYTIDSVHLAARSHVVQASTVKGRKERQAYLAHQGTYLEAKEKAETLGSARTSMHFQDVDVQNAAGDIVTAQPHMLAVVNAGMKAAAVVGLPNTFKLANIAGFSHAEFDPETDADDGIESNLTFVEKAPGGGFRFVIDNSTYGQVKDNWVLSRPAVLYAADTAAFSIRLNVETFVGQRNSDVSPETVKNLLISVMDSLRASGIIVPDANSSGKGFKDLAVTIEGSIIRVSVTLVLVEGIEFVLNDITVTRAVS